MLSLLSLGTCTMLDKQCLQRSLNTRSQPSTLYTMSPQLQCDANDCADDSRIKMLECSREGNVSPSSNRSRLFQANRCFISVMWLVLFVFNTERYVLFFHNLSLIVVTSQTWKWSVLHVISITLLQVHEKKLLVTS